eukprot:1326952-Amphidinium_carterae.2
MHKGLKLIIKTGSFVALFIGAAAFVTSLGQRPIALVRKGAQRYVVSFRLMSLPVAMGMGVLHWHCPSLAKLEKGQLSAKLKCC